VVVAGCLLAVAAPRPWTAATAPDDNASRFVTADGTVFAYQYLDTGRDRAATPVIFVNGGPGVSTRQQDLRWLEQLAADRPVLVYDQVGAGSSSRLTDPTGYTLDRARDDLETVRRHAGLDRVALVRHAWDAVVAASYVAAHLGRVEAVIALPPGSLDLDGHLAGDPSVRLCVLFVGLAALMSNRPDATLRAFASGLSVLALAVDLARGRCHRGRSLLRSSSVVGRR
jgi:pimeloyl-ACP methyl ester carboxylesterase